MLSHTLLTHCAHIVPCLHFRIVCMCMNFLLSDLFGSVFPASFCVCMNLWICCVCMWMCSQKMAIGCPFSRFWWSAMAFVLLGVCCWLPFTLFVALIVYVCSMANMLCLYVNAFSKNGDRLSLFAFLMISNGLRSSRSVLPASFYTVCCSHCVCMQYGEYVVFVCECVLKKRAIGCPYFAFDDSMMVFGCWLLYVHARVMYIDVSSVKIRMQMQFTQNFLARAPNFSSWYFSCR